MDAEPGIGQIVNVKVRRVIAGGLLVEVSGQDAAGVIRLREIRSSFEAAPDAWREMYRPGQWLRAMVIRRRDDGRFELSLRQIEQNSWQDISLHLQRGQLVNGVVTNVENYGAFIELPAGVTGLLHVSRMPPGAGGAPADLLWPGDWVKTVVESVEEAERRVGLSLLGLMERRWAHVEDAAHKLPAPSSRRPSAPVSAAEPSKLPIELLTEQAPRRFLVVEDDTDQRDALADWLRRAGQTVVAVGSGEEAQDAADERPDIALVDLGLPGMDGAETIRRLLAQQIGLRAVMMTDWSRADEYQAEIGALERQGVELLLKPLLPAELLDVLNKEFKEMATPAARQAPDAALAPVDSLASDSAHDTRALQTTLQALLTRTHALKAIVFSLDPVERRIDILAQRGRLPTDAQALPGLIRSPVRDATENKQRIRTGSAQNTDKARFRYLLPLLSFTSCIGAPIHTNLPTQAAVFIFHTRQDFFSVADEEAVEAAAQILAGILERQSFLQRAGEMQRLALLGQLSRALIHEVNHRLSPVSFALDTLQQQFTSLDRALADPRPASGLAPAELAREFHDAHRSLDHLAQAVRALVHTAKLFGKMTRVEQEAGVTLLSELATEVVDLTQDVAQQHRVKLQVEAPERLTFTRTQTTLVRQVLHNVVLNAIQQIAQWRPKEGGRVRISFEDKGSADERMVCIHVEDDGPGIHRRLWEQIFQLGYTTRKDGSGLGLHISRSLIESLGGRIYVRASHLHWGSSFCIELPFRS